MGNAYFKLNDYKNAKKSYRKAIKYNKNVAEYYYNLSFTYKKLDDLKNAQKYLDIYNKMMENL